MSIALPSPLHFLLSRPKPVIVWAGTDYCKEAEDARYLLCDLAESWSRQDAQKILNGKIRNLFTYAPTSTSTCTHMRTHTFLHLPYLTTHAHRRTCRPPFVASSIFVLANGRTVALICVPVCTRHCVQTDVIIDEVHYIDLPPCVTSQNRTQPVFFFKQV